MPDDPVQPNSQSFMKNYSSILKRGTIGALGLAYICLAGAAFGMDAQPSGGNVPSEGTRIMQRPAATPSASPAAASSAAMKGALSAQDSHFVSEAAKGGMMEVAGGKNAAKHAQNANVKQFGNRMVTDHSKANNELKAIASNKGIKLPGSASAPKWSSDKAYMDMMVQDHEQDLAAFKTEASKGSDPDLKAFASRTSKVVAEHLKMAKQVDGELK
jgi:putative membrane protein